MSVELTVGEHAPGGCAGESGPGRPKADSAAPARCAALSEAAFTSGAVPDDDHIELRLIGRMDPLAVARSVGAARLATPHPQAPRGPRIGPITNWETDLVREVENQGAW